MRTSDGWTKIRRVRCPKCGKEPHTLVELWHNHTAAFDVANGHRSRTGYLNPGDPHRVEAECRCGHTWRLRGVRQITELDLEEDDDGPDGNGR